MTYQPASMTLSEFRAKFPAIRSVYLRDVGIGERYNHAIGDSVSDDDYCDCWDVAEDYVANVRDPLGQVDVLSDRAEWWGETSSDPRLLTHSGNAVREFIIYCDRY